MILSRKLTKKKKERKKEKERNKEKTHLKQSTTQKTKPTLNIPKQIMSIWYSEKLPQPTKNTDYFTYSLDEISFMWAS